MGTRTHVLEFTLEHSNAQRSRTNTLAHSLSCFAFPCPTQSTQGDMAMSPNTKVSEYQDNKVTVRHCHNKVFMFLPASWSGTSGSTSLMTVAVPCLFRSISTFLSHRFFFCLVLFPPPLPSLLFLSLGGSIVEKTHFERGPKQETREEEGAWRKEGKLRTGKGRKGREGGSFVSPNAQY